jgi:hypothetical protein
MRAILSFYIASLNVGARSSAQEMTISRSILFDELRRKAFDVFPTTIPVARTTRCRSRSAARDGSSSGQRM